VCDFGYGGSEQTSTVYQTLVPRWVAATGGAVPADAVGGAPYVCRASYAGSLQIGSLDPSVGIGCDVTFAGQRVLLPSYEVLCTNPITAANPVAALTFGYGLDGRGTSSTLADSLIGGRDVDGSMLYPCSVYVGSTLKLGKTRLGWGTCDVDVNGQEVWVTSPQYSSLLAVWAGGWGGEQSTVNVYAAGTDTDGSSLGICSVSWAGSRQVGKAFSTWEACSFGFGGREIVVTSPANPYVILGTQK
jgi:hypothetical protein